MPIYWHSDRLIVLFGVLPDSNRSDYTLQAEICDGLFHRRGALAAARHGDEVNLDRRSSGSQFYIVWGQTYNAAQLKQLEKQLQMQALQEVFNGLVSEHRAEILQLRKDRNRAGLQELQDALEKQARAILKENGSLLTSEQLEVYTTQGVTPHLDGQYTVFGEIEEVLDVEEDIQQLPTRRCDRPVNDVVVLNMERL
ncbi:peptidyl-prolyl cis-trans isomerase, cyclophilin-type [gut metagenome]|uniref:Peptidyl-prolyl cis-trans isomerase, cyclophilin-type n=1 Tax=gut metagenome TaxID=749906 RepID=J9D9W4_9ZZZZ